MRPDELTFVSSAALVTILDRTAPDHFYAGEIWRFDLEVGATLVTTDHSLLRASMDLQAKHGLAGVEQLFRSIVPALRVERCSEADLDAAVASLLASGDPSRDLVKHLEDRVRTRLRLSRVLIKE